MQHQVKKDPSEKSPIDTYIRIVLLSGLLAWCFLILAPFISMVIWGMIIAVSLYPAYEGLRKKLGNRSTLTAIIFMFVGLAIVALPGYFIVRNAVVSFNELQQAYHAGTLHLSPPPPNVADWPVIGKTIFDLWTLASENISAVIEKYQNEVLTAIKWIAGTVASLGMDVIKFIVSIVIAGFFLMYSSGAGKFTENFFVRLLGTNGKSLANVAEKTVRNVSKGILGVAFIQSFAAGLGLYFAGVPHAGPLTLVSLLLCIIQIGVGIVAIPVIIYAFSTFSTLTAVLLTVWLIIVMVSDNVLKPLLLGKGAPVPTLVIFLGAIGGFILSGLIGLFIGAIILSLGYELFISWVDPSELNEN